MVGFVGLHPLDKKATPPVLQLRFFISGNEQRKGYGRISVQEALRMYKRELTGEEESKTKCTLWALVRKGNEASGAMLRSMGFKEAGEKTMGHEVEDAFVIDC